MSAVEKLKLSGSSDGEPVLVTATTSTAAITIHTCATAGDNTFDEVWLWGFNNATAAVTLTIEYGDTAHPIVQTLSAKTGHTLVLPGLLGNTSLVIKAFKSAATVVGVTGFVNRYTT